MESDVVSHLPCQKVKVGNRFGIVIFKCVGIDANEFYIAGNESEVGRSEHGVVGVAPCSKAVVVSYQCHVWHVQLVEYVASPQEFFCVAIFTYVAIVYHEVNVVAIVDVFDKYAQFVIPTMTVADDCHFYLPFSFAGILYARDIGGVHVGCSGNVNIVGVVVD